MIKTVTRFFSPLKGLRGKSILRLSTTILTNILTFIDIKLAANAVAAIEQKNIESLHYNVNWLFTLLGISVVLNYIFPIIWNGIGTTMGNNIDKQFFLATTKLDNNRFERKGVGYRNSILRQGSNSWTFLLNQFTTGRTRYIVQFVGSFFLLLTLKDANIVGGGIIYYVVAIIMFVFYEKLTIKNTKARRNIGKAWSSFVNRIIGSKFDILQSNKRDIESNNFDKYTNQFLKINFKQQFVGWLTRFPYLSAQFLKIGLYLYIGMKVIEGQSAIAQLIYVTSIMWQIVGGADGIVQVFIDIAENKVNLKELRSIEDEFPTIKGYADGKKFLFQSGKIEFKDVVFAYLADEKRKDIEKISDEDEEVKINKKEPVINGLNYIFESGKKYAFVGPSGGGKSTLVKLVAGYLMADKGQILVDEQELPSNKLFGADDKETYVSLSSYYPHIGYLTQEPMVFDGTIRDNLMYGISDVLSQGSQSADDLCQKALDLAHCDFVKDRENGLDTEIGEKGIKLSGGQRQRLAIARIFLKNPEIIILDEPTSALDSKSEDAVTKSMNDLFKGKTVFIIAHRLQTVKNADEILYIDGGKVVESGTHDQLIKQGGKYAELVTLQATF